MSLSFTSQTCLACMILSWMIVGRIPFQDRMILLWIKDATSISHSHQLTSDTLKPHELPAIHVESRTHYEFFQIMDGTINSWCSAIGTNMDVTLWANQYGITNQLCHESGAPIIKFLLHHTVHDLFSTRGPRMLQCEPMGFQVSAIHDE